MEEAWKPIIGYEGLYEVSNLGRVKSLPKSFLIGRRNNSKYLMTRKEQILGIHLYKHGYTYVSLSKDLKQKKFKMHRLIAIHFIPNPNNYPQINHINAIRNDNRIENLEWCTHSHNMKHKFLLGNDSNAGGRNGAAKLIFNKNTGIYYDCIQDAVECLNISRDQFRRSVNGNGIDYGLIYA